MAKRQRNAVADILGLKDKAKQSEQVIDSFRFDKEIYKEIYDQSPAIQQSVAEGDAIVRTYPDFSQDLYMSLYKHKPTLMDKEDVKDTHQFNHQLMEEIMEMDEFKKLRQKTRLDMISSALGMEVMGNQAVQIIKRYEEQMKAKNENGDSPFDGINNQVDQNGYGQNPAPGAGSGSGTPANGNGKPGQGSPGNGGKGNLTPEQAQQMANQQAGGNGQVTGQDPNGQPQPGTGAQHKIDPKLFNDMMKDMKKAAQNALDDVSETRDFLNAWGMESGDSSNRISYEDKKRALQRLRHSPKLKRLSEIVGRMKKLAINEKSQKAPDGAESIKSVVTGNDITAILPSERALLASSNKTLKNSFYRKYYQNELLQYDMDVYESMGKGPMIVCVDTSGSMRGARERWSKAVALALLEIAQKQKRNFACIHYDNSIQGVWEIPYGELKPDDVFDIAEQFSSGGTNFKAPLAECMRIIGKSEFKKADIVFTTDGDCWLDEHFTKKFNEFKKEKDFQVHTVLIDMDDGGAIEGVKPFSDRIIEVSNLAQLDGQNSGALNIFRNVQ